MIQIRAWLTSEIAENIRNERFQTGASTTEIIRRALMARYFDPLPNLNQHPLGLKKFPKVKQ